MTWQLIETAPKDSKIQILTIGASTYGKDNENGILWAMKNNIKYWFCASYYFKTIRDLDGSFYEGWTGWSKENPPTHWMPLPEFPKEQS